MQKLKTAPAILTGLVVSLGLAGTASHAQTPEEFYKGKTISIVMGTGTGGSYDAYGRTFAAHIAKHIPGKPTIIVEHMPGAGGVVAGNFIYGPAPQDGSKILLSHALPLSEILTPNRGVRYKSRDFQWLGAFDQLAQVMTIWHSAGVRSVQDLKTKDIVVGSMGTQHLTHQWALLLKEAIGAKYRVISGYKGGGALNLAMEKGEIQSWTASWENLSSTRPQWLKDKQVSIPVVFTLTRLKDLPDVPTLIEVSSGEVKEMAELLAAGTPTARGMLVGPKVPKDRVAALRKALADTCKDPAFLADTEKRKLAISYRTAEEVTGLVEKIVGASPAILEKVRKVVGATK